MSDTHQKLVIEQRYAFTLKNRNEYLKMILFFLSSVVVLEFGTYLFSKNHPLDVTGGYV